MTKVLFFFLQVVTAGPVVYSIILNGASQPGGQTGTALLPLFDLLNHDINQEVSQTASASLLSSSLSVCCDLY